MQRLIGQVASSWPRPRPLLATLSAALRSIERGNPVSAINHLLASQNQVRAQVAPSNSALAASFIQAAQEVIDVLSGGNTNPGGRPHGRFASVRRQPNGQVQLQFAAEPGPTYVVEASTNLVQWTKLSVRTNTTGTVQFDDPGATNCPARFYRLAVP